MVHRPFFLGLLLVLGLSPAWAHPHVWIDVRAEVAVAGGYVEGVWTIWTFDDVFSQLILADHDPAGTGKIDAEANSAIKKGYFDNLRTYGFFSHFALGPKTLAVPSPQKFQASVNPQGRVVYRFFLPLGLRLDAKTPLAVSFYDETFFTDMVFEKNSPVLLTVSDGGKASVALKPDKAKTFYGGQVTPTYAFISWSPS
jgi:ABC-type uncharacterized transport system substrate-binding protein